MSIILFVLFFVNTFLLFFNNYLLNTFIIWGPNIIKPIIAAPIATTKTAPAAISFANFALGFL